MRAILGRLSDLGIRELFKLLTSVRAEGALEVESPAGPARLSVRQGHVAGEISAPLVVAYATRGGTFCFRPGLAEEIGEWIPVEELLARLEAAARAAAGPRRPESTGEGAADGSEDPLAELRESLSELPLTLESTRVLVVTSDPRHYRALDPEWRQRGWEVQVTAEPVWPEGPPPALLIVHLPAYGTLAGQGESWLNLVRTAATRSPAVPVVWVGGLADASLRHKAILAGASFLLPAPAGDVGETARWFREEMGVIAERLMSRLAPEPGGEAEAFRDFFLALHVDATPAEARASLLRFASSYFARGALLAVRENAFESLGTYGLTSMTAVRLPRGAALLEDVVVTRRPLAVAEAPSPEGAALAVALGTRERLEGVEILPALIGNECVALFVGASPLPHEGGSEGLAALLARAGGMLGV